MPATPTTADRPKRERAPRLPTIEARLPVCEECGGTDFALDGKQPDQGDGSYVSYGTCRKCGSRFRILFEPFTEIL